MPPPVLVTFSAGTAGEWTIDRSHVVIGDGVPGAARMALTTAPYAAPTGAAWTLRGLISHIRYTTRPEMDALASSQPGLDRSEAVCAAMIPIRKSRAWWALAQDERRAIFEEQSRHIGIGMDYLPAIARRLHHSRDLGEAFDFVTWFEYAPADEPAFDGLLARLRATAEWGFVEREVDLRLRRA